MISRSVLGRASTISCQIAKRFMATYKTSTGLVGLAVDPTGRDTLLRLSSQVLENVQKIPADSGYRIQVEQWFKYINKVCHEKTEVKAIEDAIDLGQIEEVIEYTKDELECIDFYYDNKVWERVQEVRQEADILLDKLSDSIYFNDPTNKASYQKEQRMKAAEAAKAAAAEANATK